MLRLLRRVWIVAALASFGAAHAADSRTLPYDGRDRTYLVYRPADLSRTRPAPLVIMLHGGFGTGEFAEAAYNWDAEADRNGFVVVYPDGSAWSWNAGGKCCGLAQSRNVDDVGFLTALIQTVSRDENIDAKRVYLTGMSNGAAMSYRYACEGSFPVAAFGVASGSLAYACGTPHAVSLMEIHGLDDHVIPMAGGHGERAGTDVDWLGVDATLDTFRKAGGCGPSTLREEGVVKTATAACAHGREVVLITIAGAGHQWPGSNPRRGLFRGMVSDPPSTALDATSTLWDFFKAHSAD